MQDTAIYAPITFEEIVMIVIRGETAYELYNMFGKKLQEKSCWIDAEKYIHVDG
mgnify:CR=1 FL=1